MTLISTDFCPVCGNKQFSLLHSCRDNLVSGEDYSIYTCGKCGFAFTQDFPSENEIGKYYEAAEYVSHSDTQKGIINSLYHLARKYALNSKIKLVKSVSGKKTGSLLDVGAGTGYFLNHVKNEGWNVSGVEKSEQARSYAKEKFGLDLQDSDSLFIMPEKSHHVITLWHVLEHLEKLNETMQCLHRILKDDGTLIIALPNKKSVDAVYYKKNWAAYDVPRHLWHFSPSDFSELARKNGFEVRNVKPMYLDVFYISMLSEKNRNKSPFVGLVKGGFFFLQSLPSINKVSSVIYILKKIKN